MPRIRQYEEKYAREDILREIRTKQGACNLMHIRALADATGIPYATLRRRMMNPDDFTVAELRKLNVVIHLEQLRRKTVSRSTVFRGNYEDYIRQRSAAFQNQEREALNDQRQEKIREEKFQRLYQQVEHAQATVSRQDPHGGQLLKKKMTKKQLIYI